MRQVRGTESIFYIKHEGIWCPVACETSSGMSEQTEMISTTTRDNGGWKTEKPTLQGYSISVSGALVNELPSFDYYGRNLLRNSESIKLSAYSGSTVVHTDNFAVSEWGATTAVRHQTSGGTDFLKALYSLGVLANGDVVTLSFYAKNLGTNTVSLYSNQGNKTTDLLPGEQKLIKWEGIVGNGSGILQIQARTLDVAHSLDFAIWRAKYEKGAVATPYSIAPEDQKILSYFKLRQKKRNRELIEWKRETLGKRYIDSGRAYITDISDENPVDDMMMFTMTLSGFGKPDFFADDSVIVAEAFANYNDDLVANSNNQILEP